MQNIFVYGTLKHGHEFAAPLVDQEFLTEARTTAQYWMFSLGTYPGLVDAEQMPGDMIQGEVYRVYPKCRRLLDQIECVDSGMYELREIQLEAGADLAPVFAYFYLGSVAGCKRLVRWP